MTKRKFKQAEIDAKNAWIHGRSGRIVRAIEAYNQDLTEGARHDKYCKMAASAYALYRGTNHLYWMDFEWDWRLTRFGSYRTRTWLNGDCHAYNFGAYDVHDVGVVYGLNDFDEAIVADYQYDLWRLAVSLVLIARENGDLDDKSQVKAIDALSRTYLETLVGFAGAREADEIAYTAANTDGRLRKFLRKVEKKKSRGKLLAKWTSEVAGQARFDLSLTDKLKRVDDEVREKIVRAVRGYVRTIRGDRRFPRGFFRVRDVAQRLGAGTGSLGTARYYLLIEGDKNSPADDIILDVKRQSRPSAYPYATPQQIAEYRRHFRHEGIRHSLAYRALGFHPDDLLGWMKIDSEVYSVRERSPYKESFPTSELTSEKRFVNMAEHWGRGLATEHARADKITDYSLAREVAILIKGRKKPFRAMVCEVAFGYADQVEQDWQTFLEHLAPDDCPPVD